MIAWSRRPRLVAHFLNPALMAAVVAASAVEYRRIRTEPMPWVFVFLLAPLVLHGPTRRALPRDTRTHLSTWIARNQSQLAGFAERVTGLAPGVREGIRYGVRSGALSVSDRSIVSDWSLPRGAGQLSELLLAAALAGRWFAKLDQPATAYALFGVTP